MKKLFRLDDFGAGCFGLLFIAAIITLILADGAYAIIRSIA
jgi:hypothetical protein